MGSPLSKTHTHAGARAHWWCGVGPGTFKGFWLGILAFAHGLFEIYLQPSGVCAEISLPRKGYTFATSVGEKGVSCVRAEDRQQRAFLTISTKSTDCGRRRCCRFLFAGEGGLAVWCVVFCPIHLPFRRSSGYAVFFGAGDRSFAAFWWLLFGLACAGPCFFCVRLSLHLERNLFSLTSVFWFFSSQAQDNTDTYTRPR